MWGGCELRERERVARHPSSRDEGKIDFVWILMKNYLIHAFKISMCTETSILQNLHVSKILWWSSLSNQCVQKCTYWEKVCTTAYVSENNKQIRKMYILVKAANKNVYIRINLHYIVAEFSRGFLVGGG